MNNDLALTTYGEGAVFFDHAACWVIDNIVSTRLQVNLLSGGSCTKQKARNLLTMKDLSL